MLEILIPENELWNEATQEFLVTKPQRLRLEHSLVSLSKWESKWKKPFLSTDKNKEETIDYIRCMTVSPNIDELSYYLLSNDNMKDILDYIADTMTATTFPSDEGTNREVVTSELIYYWMIALNIPMECQKWHLNRLITLIRVCIRKSQTEKKTKMNSNDLAQREALNAARKKKMNTKG